MEKNNKSSECKERQLTLQVIASTETHGKIAIPNLMRHTLLAPHVLYNVLSKLEKDGLVHCSHATCTVTRAFREEEKMKTSDKSTSHNSTRRPRPIQRTRRFRHYRRSLKSHTLSKARTKTSSSKESTLGSLL